MFKNVTIGQYYPAESPLHRLDPRTKLLAVVAYIAALFFIKPMAGYALAFGVLAAAVWASKVPPGYLLRGLRGIFFIILFTAGLNVFLTPGETVIFHWAIFTITKEGALIAVKMTIRLILLVACSSILTLTTTPTSLTDALEALLKPLKKVKAPVHEIAMMMTIALRFIPTLMEEMDKIMKAQMARGADFDTGGLVKKARALIPLLVPLFLSAIRRADELATAMEARCYRGDVNRTKMKVMRFMGRDYAFFAYVLLFFASVFGVNALFAQAAPTVAEPVAVIAAAPETPAPTVLAEPTAPPTVEPTAAPPFVSMLKSSLMPTPAPGPAILADTPEMNAFAAFLRGDYAPGVAYSVSDMDRYGNTWQDAGIAHGAFQLPGLDEDWAQRDALYAIFEADGQPPRLHVDAHGGAYYILGYVDGGLAALFQDKRTMATHYTTFIAQKDGALTMVWQNGVNRQYYPSDIDRDGVWTPSGVSFGVSNYATDTDYFNWAKDEDIPKAEWDELTAPYFAMLAEDSVWHGVAEVYFYRE